MPSNIKKAVDPRSNQRRRQKARRQERNRSADERLALGPLTAWRRSTHKFEFGRRMHFTSDSICLLCELEEDNPVHELPQIKLV